MKTIDLFTGWVYKLYMGLVAVFCTNSVNILAGVNGLEVGQTVIISCAVSVLHRSYHVELLKYSSGMGARDFISKREPNSYFNIPLAITRFES
jgi:UDP-N-acetylmuramyl pentapeptide phosphotransferase/UDP-N-acetylglucosamine-1-phosphate transferase